MIFGEEYLIKDVNCVYGIESVGAFSLVIGRET